MTQGQGERLTAGVRALIAADDLEARCRVYEDYPEIFHQSAPDVLGVLATQARTRGDEQLADELESVIQVVELLVKARPLASSPRAADRMVGVDEMLLYLRLGRQGDNVPFFKKLPFG